MASSDFSASDNKNHATASISQAHYDTLKALAPGWDGYSAMPLTDEALHTLRCVTVVPTSRGGWQIEWHTLAHDVEIVVEPDGDVSSVSWERVPWKGSDG